MPAQALSRRDFLGSKDNDQIIDFCLTTEAQPSGPWTSSLNLRQWLESVGLDISQRGGSRFCVEQRSIIRAIFDDRHLLAPADDMSDAYLNVDGEPVKERSPKGSRPTTTMEGNLYTWDSGASMDFKTGPISTWKSRSLATQCSSGLNKSSSSLSPQERRK